MPNILLWLAPLLLVSFGVTRSVATLGVLAWRLVNFWLPIPACVIAYVSLKVPRGAGLKAMRAAVTSMMTHPGASDAPPPDPQDVTHDAETVAHDAETVAHDAETTDRSAP